MPLYVVTHTSNNKQEKKEEEEDITSGNEYVYAFTLLHALLQYNEHGMWITRHSQGEQQERIEGMMKRRTKGGQFSYSRADKVIRWLSQT